MAIKKKLDIKTKPHFRKLIEIIKEDGFLTALDYDYQITKYRHPLFNFFMEDVEYLKTPSLSWHGDNEIVHNSKYYTAKYVVSFNKQILAELQLK
jgi:hypothetical protein